MRFVRQHDHIRPVAEHFRRLEFMNEREDEAVIPAQEFAQLCATLRMAFVAFCSLTAPQLP